MTTATDLHSASEGAAAIRTLTLLRRLTLIAVFIAGIAGGIWLYFRINPPLDYGPYPPLAEAAEPRAADVLVDLVELGDERTLAERYPTTMLDELATALTVGPPGGEQPLAEIRRVDYLGSISDGIDTVALYVALGTTAQGMEVSTGFSIRVRDGEVVGVN